MNSLETSPVGRHGSIGVEVLPHDLGVETLPPDVQALIRQVEAIGDKALLAARSDIKSADLGDAQPTVVYPDTYL